MKRAIALLMTILTLCAALPLGSVAAPDDTAVQAAEAAAALPASTTLVGTSALPPVPNQGGVGSCASEAITYRQFTNAVARYMNAVAPDEDWDPSSGNKAQIFSPKFTYTLSGSGTAWVYDVLVDHGCLPLSKSAFAKDKDGGSQYKQDGKLVQSAVKWDVEDDLMQSALSYRLKKYDQIWVNKDPYYTNGDKINDVENIKITTSDAGQALITKIKDALVRGNAVVTGGHISRWLTGYLTGDGEIGRAGEPAIIASAGKSSGGHQVTIVGYDDGIKCKVGDSTMEGGFLVSNSWGEEWGKDGYEWLMYDALNTVSEHEEYNKDGFYSGDMYIDALNDKTVIMNPTYSATGDQTVTFTKAGKVTVNGQSYTTYHLYSEAMGGYLAYNTSNTSDTSLHIEKTSGKNTEWAFISYETMKGWSVTKKEYVDDSYKDSYWVYAAGRSSVGASGYAYLDAGLGVSSSGRSVGIASHYDLRYPEAKSWYATIDESKDSFTSPLGIFAGRGTSQPRSWTMDQFIFTYWDEDVTLEKPELYVKMDITTDNREGLYFRMTRQPKKGTGGLKTEEPAVSQYYSHHPTYDIEGGWNQEGNKMTFSGIQNGNAETATIYLSYSTLLNDLPKDTTLADYKWGIQFGVRRKTDATISNVQLLSQDGQVLQTLEFENGEKSLTLEAPKNGSMTTPKYSGNYTFGDLPGDAYTAKVTAGKGLTVTPVTTGELHYGDAYTFKVTVDKNYARERITVRKNGVPLLGKDGVYTTTVCGDLEITASGAIPFADMNGDKDATIADATAMLAYLTGSGTLPKNATPDLTGDGKVSTKDLTRLLLFLEDEETVLSPGRPVSSN